MPIAELSLIRHAPVTPAGRLHGRTDPAARLDLVPGGCGLRPARLLSSPARRCTGTAEALFRAAAVETDPRLWEQDFGRHDGSPLADLPDLGPLSAADLARHRWPGGESFADMAARVAPALSELAGAVAIVAHAGTIRAALALALGTVPAALAFEIAPLSLTRITRHAQGWSVACVNAAL